MVQLADWMDEFEVQSHRLPGKTLHPCRTLAPRLYQPVADAGVERLFNDPEAQEEIRRDITGRAQRQLVYRGNDATPAKSRKGTGISRSSDPGGISWKLLAVFIVVGVVLLMVKWWLGGLVLVAAAGYVIYQFKKKAD
jgi:hypothetical protein